MTALKSKQVKTIFTFCMVFFLSFSSYSQGFLKVNGKHLENDENKNFILRGMGLGGWMLQEGYMFQLGFLGQQYKIKQKIASLVGEKETENFYKNWLQFHTQEADIDSMAAWGFNSIRLPMHYNLFTLPVKDEPVAGKNTWLKEGFEKLDEILGWCKKNNIYLILDLHAAPGGQGADLPISDRNPEEPSLWESEANQQKTIELWRELAARYADEPNIGGYDILNETNWGFLDPEDKRGIGEKKNIPLKKLMMEITEAIRSVDKNHIIYLEGNGFTTKGTIQNFLDLREKYNVPLWLGESGENSNTWFTNTIKLMEDNNIGWCWWQLKKMGINNPLEIKRIANYDQFINYSKGDGPKPTEKVSLQILNDLLKNIKIENNIYHKDVTDAMFRQVHSIETLPFTSNIIGQKSIIKAADFDLGRNGFAYNDKDTASYMYTPGVHTQGNRGRSYRNDGVDIKTDENSAPYVFYIENGEWLLYTLFVEKEGNYNLSFSTSDSAGVIDIYKNEKLIAKNVSLPAGKDSTKWTSSKPVNIHLNKGENKLKIYFVKGGFNFRNFELEMKK